MTNLCLDIIIFILLPCSTAEANLRIQTYPVGQGDATIIECDDNPQKISITLIDAGSGSIAKRGILAEYLTYLTTKLRNPRYRIEHIFLTIPDLDHYGFIIDILSLLKDEEAKKIKFYIGGTRTSYTGLDLSTTYDENVFEFTRKHEDANRISSCGHYPWGNTNLEFIKCMQRSSKGPIPNTNGVISICNDFQITVMAANFGFSHELGGPLNETDTKHKSSLVLKITPRGKSVPSMLIIGDFENDDSPQEDNASGKVFLNYIKGTHSHYVDSPDTPMTITRGLESTILMVPQHGADTNINDDGHFFSTYVKPTYAVISSDIQNNYGYPKCKVLKALNSYMRQFAVRNKGHQCHFNSNIPSIKDMVHGMAAVENIFQTTVVDPTELLLQYNLINFMMTQSQVHLPTIHNVFIKGV